MQAWIAAFHVLLRLPSGISGFGAAPEKITGALAKRLKFKGTASARRLRSQFTIDDFEKAFFRFFLGVLRSAATRRAMGVRRRKANASPGNQPDEAPFVQKQKTNNKQIETISLLAAAMPTDHQPRVKRFYGIFRNFLSLPPPRVEGLGNARRARERR